MSDGGEWPSMEPSACQPDSGGAAFDSKGGVPATSRAVAASSRMKPGSANMRRASAGLRRCTSGTTSRSHSKRPTCAWCNCAGGTTSPVAAAPVGSTCTRHVTSASRSSARGLGPLDATRDASTFNASTMSPYATACGPSRSG